LHPRHALQDLWVWQLFSYPFVYAPSQLLSMLFDMLILYFFAREVERLYGPRKLLLLYVLGGVFAGLLHCLFHLADTAPVLGASASVFAVLLVFTLHFPKQRIWFFFVIAMEMWLATTIFCLLYLALALSNQDRSAVLPLGGALFGYLFYRYQGRVERYIDRVDHRMDRRQDRREVDMEKRLDELLEKINRSGLTSLTRREKEFLKRTSRHFQKRQ
jgi:membrane associated rhomboid family serine protease